MPNGNQSLLSFTDIFSQLGLDDKYLGMLQDPSKYFGLGQEYAKFFPGAEMYQQQLSTLLGTGEGSLAEREATLRGQVEQRYGIGTRGAEARYGLGTQATEERFRYGREQERERGTQSFLGLGEQFRQQQAQTGFTGGGAVKSGYSTAQQDITRGYGQRVGALGAARQQRLGELGASRTQAMEEFGAGKQRGMFGVEEDIAGLRGQAQSLMGQYIQSLFGIGRDIWASMPDPGDKEYTFEKTTEYGKPGAGDTGPPGWPDAAAYERWRAAGSDPNSAVAYGWQAPYPDATPGHKGTGI